MLEQKFLEGQQREARGAGAGSGVKILGDKTGSETFSSSSSSLSLSLSHHFDNCKAVGLPTLHFPLFTSATNYGGCQFGAPIS